MTQPLPLAQPGTAHPFGDLAALVAEREPDAVVRVLADGGRVAVVAATPFDVLVLRAAAVQLAGAAVEHPRVDLVVEAGTLAATAAEGDGSLLRLPPPVDPLRWTWPLPPRAGWQPGDDVPLADLFAARASAVRAFRTAVEAMAPGERTRAALERLATEQWDVDLAPGVSVRMAHAAAAHGFLPPEPVGATAAVRTLGRWRRLDTSAGSVLSRAGGLTLRV